MLLAPCTQVVAPADVSPTPALDRVTVLELLLVTVTPVVKVTIPVIEIAPELVKVVLTTTETGPPKDMAAVPPTDCAEVVLKVAAPAENVPADDETPFWKINLAAVVCAVEVQVPLLVTAFAKVFTPLSKAKVIVPVFEVVLLALSVI